MVNICTTRTMRYCISILGLLIPFIGHAQPFQQVLEAKSDKAAASALVRNAVCDGHIRIIVGLDLEAMDASHFKSRKINQRLSLAAAQDILINRLSKMNARAVRKFAHMPMLAMEVDAATLAFLLSTPIVATIHEDSLNMPRNRTPGDVVRQHQTRTKRGGTIPVIVNLAILPDQGIQQSNRPDFRRIAKAQQDLLQGMSKFRVDSIKRYKYTPQLAMRVGSDGLNFLLSSPAICSVQEDATAFPLMTPSALPMKR